MFYVQRVNMDKTCHVCDKSFSRPYTYRRHMLERHNQVINPAWTTAPTAPPTAPTAPPTAPTAPPTAPTAPPTAPTAPPTAPIAPTISLHGLEWEVNMDGEKLIYVPNLQHPFTCMVSGPTGCGKSTFITKLLQQRQEVIHSPPERVIWCYSEWHLYTTL